MRAIENKGRWASCASYGWNASSPEFNDEAARVSTLMRLYQRLTTPDSN